MQKSLVIALVLSAGGTAFAAGGKCPNVVIVLDKSGSMEFYPSSNDSCVNNCPPSAGGSCKCGACIDTGDCNSGESCIGATQSTYGYCSGTKMPIAHQVIQNVLLGQGGATAPSPNVRFGFTYFPSDSSCGPSQANPLVVAAGYGTTQQIVTRVNAIQPDGSTPTGESLNNLLNDPSMKESDRPRYVLLVTDGEPTCGGNPTGGAVSAVQTLRSNGIQTFVVGFGSGTAGSTTLEQMANAGASYPDGGAYDYFSASDQASLSNALAQIIQTASSGELGGTTSCDPCLDVSCGAGQICQPSTGQCVNDPYGPCRSAGCAADTFCRVDANGQAVCEHACDSPCATGEVCSDGNCVADPCANGACGSCPDASQVHDESGNCVGSQCNNGDIVCPNSTFCTNNQCQALFSGTTSTGGTTSTTGTSTGGSGSSGTTGKKANGNVSSSGGCSSTTGAAWAGLALVGLALISRRRD